VGCSPRSAAILVAHALVELGETKLQAMSPAEVTTWAVTFSRRFPMPWSSILRQDTRSMCNHMTVSKILHETWQDYELATARIVASTQVEQKFPTPPVVGMKSTKTLEHERNFEESRRAGAVV
jgi:hypothetical protein